MRIPRRSIQPLLLLLAAALTLAACAGGDDAGAQGAADVDAAATQTEPETAPDDAESSAPEDAADPAPAQELPLTELVGELIMTKLDGPVATDAELAAIRRLHVGGIILFGPNVVDERQLRELVHSIDAARRSAAERRGLPARVVVSVDQEGGPIRNVPFAPPELSQPRLAQAGSDATFDAALATGTRLAELGIGMDLGPVADLAQGPNRTMAGRSFGSDPAAVAPLIARTVEGLEQGGVAAAAKHFPGFGAATANSDDAVAYVDRSIEQLRDAELVPFRAAIDAEVDSIMVSHGIHRELGSTLPGTLDPRIATELLREELGFEGVAMTDSMNARGLREAWGDTVPRACPVAIDAGIDLLLLTGSLETARLCRDRVLEAVREGTLDEERVREAVARVIELRSRLARPTE